MAVFDQIFADIGDEQSIEQSLSTFSSHINDIVAIMKRVSDQSLVLIDEIGAGTDPEEGASLAISILDFFRKKGAKIIVTTHYPELKLYGYNRERTTNASMEFDIKTLSPTYRLQMGIPGHSNAFAIARRLGMREDVVVGAEKLMSSDDSDINHMIDELNKQTKLATENKQKLQTSLDRAKQLEKKLQDALDIYNQRVQKQLDFALDRANEIVAKKRKKADKIIAELEEARKEGMQVKTNQLMDAKGEFNQLAKQEVNLAKNKVLQKEKKRHHVQVGDKVKVLSYGQTGTVTKQLGEHDYEVSLGRIKLKVTDRYIDKLAAGRSSRPKDGPLLPPGPAGPAVPWILEVSAMKRPWSIWTGTLTPSFCPALARSRSSTGSGPGPFGRGSSSISSATSMSRPTATRQPMKAGPGPRS